VSSIGRRPALREDEIDTLLEHVRRGLRPALERLDNVQLPPDIVGVDHRSREEYIEMMCRLIRNAVSEDTQIQAGLADDIQGLGSW